MAASEYLSQQSDEDSRLTPLKAAVYTGVTYVFTVLFLFSKTIDPGQGKCYGQIMRKILVFVFCFVLVAAVHTFAESKAPIKIGVLTDLTGRAAYLGRWVQAGAELAEEDLNHSGLPVEIIYGDNAFNTTRAISELQKMLSVDKIDFLFVNFTPIVRAVAPIVQRQGKIMIYTAAAVSPLKDNPLAFKSYLDYVEGCRKIAACWQGYGVTRPVFLKPISEYGELCQQGLRRVYLNIPVIDYSMGEPVAAQVLRIKQMNAEAVLNPSYEVDLVNMLQTLRSLKFKPLLGIEESGFTGPVVKDFKFLIPEYLFFGMPSPSTGFKNRLRNFRGDDLSGGIEHAVMAYLHLSQGVRALSKCRKRRTRCFRENLRNSPPDKDFGFIKFDAAQQAVFNWTLRRFREGTVEQITVDDCVKTPPKKLSRD